MAEIHKKTKQSVKQSEDDNEPDNIPEELYKLYPRDITLYENRPDGVSNLKEIEKLIEQRFEVLMIIKNAKDKGFVYDSEAWNKHILDMLTNSNLLDYIRLLYYPDRSSSNCTTCKWSDITRRRRDLLSHYMLVLSCCHDENTMSALWELETDLFHIKFQHLTSDKIKEFIQTYPDVHLKLITNVEKNQYREDLLNCTTGFNENNFDDTDFYKVPFTSALDLVENVNCFLRRGLIYVPHYNAVYLFKNIFKEHLGALLMYYGQNIKEMTDERIVELIHNANASSNQIAEDYNPNGRKVKLSELKNHSQNSFPLCTRNLYEAMHRFHHLKYHGRQLLQLFLKDIGLSVQDCLEFFRIEFTKRMDEKQFQKDYGYYIRHNYGLVGSKIKFKAPNCMEVMDRRSCLRPGQYHGCPFKLWDLPLLTKRLAGCGISDEGITDICDIVQEGHAQIACSKFFELTHNGLKVDIHHPNQFYEESRKYYSSKEQQQEQEPQPSTSTSK